MSFSAAHVVEPRKVRGMDWRQGQLAGEDLSFGGRVVQEMTDIKGKLCFSMFHQAKRWTAKLGGFRYERPD